MLYSEQLSALGLFDALQQALRLGRRVCTADLYEGIKFK